MLQVGVFQVCFVVGVQSHSLYLPESKILQAALLYTTQSCLCIEPLCVSHLYTCVRLFVCVKCCQVGFAGRDVHKHCKHAGVPYLSSVRLQLIQLVPGLEPVKMDCGWNGEKHHPRLSFLANRGQKSPTDQWVQMHLSLNKTQIWWSNFSPQWQEKHRRCKKAIFILHILWRSALASAWCEQERAGNKAAVPSLTVFPKIPLCL